MHVHSKNKITSSGWLILYSCIRTNTSNANLKALLFDDEIFTKEGKCINHKLKQYPTRHLKYRKIHL